jgi:hypothetical protein
MHCVYTYHGSSMGVSKSIPWRDDCDDTSVAFERFGKFLARAHAGRLTYLKTQVYTLREFDTLKAAACSDKELRARHRGVRKQTPEEMYPLSDRPGKADDIQTVRHIMHANDPVRPVLLFCDGATGAYTLLEGEHRLVAAYANNCDIKARVYVAM